MGRKLKITKKQDKSAGISKTKARKLEQQLVFPKIQLPGGKYHNKSMIKQCL